MPPPRAPVWAYIATFVAASLLSVAMTPVARRVARSRGILDHPGPLKIHAEAVPYLGGLAIVASFSAAVGLAAVAWHQAQANLGVLAICLGLGSGLSVLGLADDLLNLPKAPKLLVETAAAAAVYWSGTRSGISGAPGWADLLVTMVWIVGITNALNLLDHQDGLSAGVTVLAAVAVACVGLVNGQVFVPILALALAGCALGFLRHNFHPAVIHMGDAGSLFLGFVLAVLTLRLRGHPQHEVSLSVPILLLAVPIFDTSLVVASRLWHRRSPLQGYPDHTTHRLVAMGWPVRRSVMVVYVAATLSGLAAVGLTRAGRITSYGVTGGVLLLALGAALILIRADVYRDSVLGPPAPAPHPHESGARSSRS